MRKGDADDGDDTESERKTKRGREQSAWAEKGGYMQAKIQKLIDKYDSDKIRSAENLDAGGSKSYIFTGIAIFVNGYSEPSFDVLRQLMIENGGRYEHYYSAARVTHIVATSLAQSKQKQFRDKKVQFSRALYNISYRFLENRRFSVVVLPTWITESVERQALQPYQNYLLLHKDPILRYMTRAVGGKNDAELSSRGELDCYDDMPALESSDEDDVQKDQPTTSTGSLHSTSHQTNPAQTSHPVQMLRADNEGFIAEFYGNSRLHHISHWRMHLKDMVNDIRTDANHQLTGRAELEKRLTEGSLTPETDLNTKVYMHIDMDCFFVSVALRSRPELRDQPVAVAHSKGDGTSEARLKGSMSEISSCNYLARQAGVKNGMFMGSAVKLCPHLITVPYDFEGYSEVSTKLYKIVASYTTEIEAVSCDELFVDITSLLPYDTPTNIAKTIRDEIKRDTACPCSVGMGANLLLARLATRKAKPDGQYHVTEDGVTDFMLKQEVKNLPGVGRATKRRLEQLGATNCEQLQALPLSQLKHEFGLKSGDTLYKLCRGVDERILKPDQPRQSVSCDINYGIRLAEPTQVDSLLKNVCSEVSKKLSHAKLTGKQVTLKVKVKSADAPEYSAKFMGHGICDSMSKSSSLKTSTSSSELIYSVCSTLWRSFRIKPSDLRGVGIQVTKLEPCREAAFSSQTKVTDFSTSSTLNRKKKPEERRSHNSAFRTTTAIKCTLPYSHDGPPQLCGRSREKDVEKLVNRWIRHSPDSPLDVDTARFTPYVVSLVKSGYLSITKSVLLRIKWSTKASEGWKSYLRSLLDCVQKAASDTYGVRLDISL